MRTLILLTAAAVLLGCPDNRLRRTLPPDVRIDQFEQKGASQVDVLWVIDNSGSMLPRQENLAKNFQSFIELFSRGAVDYRIAVTTTDIFKEQGRFVGSPRILTPSTPNLVTAFAANVRVGVDGSAYEAGLLAAQLSLEAQARVNAPKVAELDACKLECGKDPNPVICVEGCGERVAIDFLRPEAFLYLVFVTDEEDRSAQDIRYFWRAFETAKGIGNDATVTTAAIIGDVPQNSCGATPGTRYTELSRLTGGEVGSICDESFAQTLKKLATNAVGLKRKFALQRSPNPDTITVRVLHACGTPSDALAGCAEVDASRCEGAPADERALTCTPPKGGEHGWSYESAGQVVFFAGDSVPGLNTTVELEYYEEGTGPS